MPEPKNRSFTIEAKFVAFDPNVISPGKANGLIKQMRSALAEFKFKSGEISAYVLVIDEFNCDQINTNFLNGRWNLRIELCDLNRDGGATSRFNTSNDGGFGKAICDLKFTRYMTIIKIVSDYDHVGDLTVENPKKDPGNIDPSSPTVGEQKYDFYERFSASIADFTFLARVLILEKELSRLRTDVCLTEEARKHLVNKVSTSINSLKQNMGDKEKDELSYVGVSLDLIPSI